MDSELLFWLALIVVYLLQAVFGKKKPPQTSAPDSLPGLPMESEPEGQFSDALSEISELLQRESRPAPSVSTPPADYQAEPKQLRTRSLESPLASFRTKKGSFTSATDSHFYDESFEDQKGGSFHAPVILHDNADAEPEAKPLGRSLSTLVREDTHSHDRLKEAIILADVLGPPRSRRG